MRNIFLHPEHIVCQIMIGMSFYKFLLILCVSIKAGIVVAYSSGAGACPGGEVVSIHVCNRWLSIVRLSFSTFRHYVLGRRGLSPIKRQRKAD
jgi:hypothetical protein